MSSQAPSAARQRNVAPPVNRPARPDPGVTPMPSGGNEMSERIERFDWAATPLGAPATWSPSLKMMVPFLTANRFPLLLWWGPDFIQIYNDAYIPILGTKHPSPGLGRPVRECWSEIWGVLRPLIETPFRGGPATWMEDILLEINRHGAKEETHFTIAYSPVPDDTVPGGIGGVLATVNEITDKVLAERRGAALRDLVARLTEARTADDACRIAGEALAARQQDVPFVRFYLLDDDGARACRASGPTLGPLDFCPDIIDLAAPSPWPVATALRTGAMQIVNGLGDLVPGLPAGPWSVPTDSAVVVPIPAGRPGEFAGIMLAGISAIRKLDALYQDFFEGIRAQVATAIARARAYEDERRRAEALAELDRAKMEFFSNVSHEFRTPLTLMLGPMEDVLAHSALAAADRNQLETVHRNSLRLLKLVNTMLDFSRIEAGRMETNCEEVDLAALTAELASVFRAAAERAGLQFIVSCPPLGQPAFVDRNMWEKIVLNLVSNALKFTLAGEIEVKLERKNGAAELTVRDTGIGIPPEEVARVFERFHRVKEARGRTHEGTGIGLSLAQELARLHGGTIRCESELNQGSRFIVTLPLARARTASTPPFPPPVSAGDTRDARAFAEEALHWDGAAPGFTAAASAPPRRVEQALPSGERRPRVIWADDNADMREYVARLLAGRFEVQAVPDGRAALDAARAEPPDLVLSDVMMPRLDGFGLLREMRADPTLQRIPVVLLSARAGEDERMAGVGSGADDYLTKPFTARELLARVEAQVKLTRLRHATEARVRESEERFRALATTSAYVLYRMNPDWSEMTELDGRGFLGDTREPNWDWMEQYILPEDRPLVTRRIEQAITGRNLFELEHRVRRIDGSVGWTLSRAVPLLDSRGEIREWFGAATDVTARREADEVLRQRTAQLQRARDDALAANRAKDEFLATLSHELRTPLNPVLLVASEATADAALDEEVRANFKMIADNVALQARLIDDLLDLNRITRGKITMERQPLDVHDVVRDAAATVQEEIAAKSLRLEFALDAAAHQVQGDPVRLRQVCWNVLKNAVKFTPAGGSITIASRNLPGSHEIEVRISDSGIGMRPEELARIFHPFVQGRHTHDDPGGFGGLGLGLAISRMLTEIHGGSITAESAGQGRGTAVVLRLPLEAAKPAETERTPQVNGHRAPVPAGPDGRAPRRVLFVEDHEPTREAMTRLLRRRGYAVTSARSVGEALERSGEGAFDLLISDLGLPDGDGYRLMTELSRRHPGLVGIAISGYGMEDDVERSRVAGFGEHLTKPVSIDSLERALLRLLKDGRKPGMAEGREQEAARAAAKG